MKLILCLLPLLCLVLYFNSVDADVSVPEKETVRVARSSNEEDPDITDDGEEAESDKDEGEIASENGDEDNDESVPETPGTKKLLKLGDKPTNIFENKNDEQISEVQKKLAQLKYGGGY